MVEWLTRGPRSFPCSHKYQALRLSSARPRRVLSNIRGCDGDLFKTAVHHVLACAHKDRSLRWRQETASVPSQSITMSCLCTRLSCHLTVSLLHATLGVRHGRLAHPGDSGTVHISETLEPPPHSQVEALPLDPPPVACNKLQQS